MSAAGYDVCHEAYRLAHEAKLLSEDRDMRESTSPGVLRMLNLLASAVTQLAEHIETREAGEP